MKRDISEWLGVVLLLLGGLTLSAPFVLQSIDSAGQTASAEAAALPTPDGRRMIEEAKAYNEGLSARPQSVLGEAGDTFSGTSYSGGDKEYRGLLDADGKGTMGAVRYPRLHISLPVRHGTDAATLERSAGHLYGTSLPVGGESTHAVVAAHRGLADRLMFTNLGLAKKGDLFEIDVQGERLHYKVTNSTGEVHTFLLANGEPFVQRPAHHIVQDHDSLAAVRLGRAQPETVAQIGHVLAQRPVRPP